MSSKSGNRESTISGKPGKELAIAIMERIKRVIEKMNVANDEIIKVSRLTNIREIVFNIKVEYDNIISMIEDTIRSDSIDIASPEEYIKGTRAIDHLLQDIPEPDPNDLKSVLLNAVKENKELQHVLSLMASEYKVKSVSKVVSSILEHLDSARSKLETLYEDLINRDYW